MWAVGRAVSVYQYQCRFLDVKYTFETRENRAMHQYFENNIRFIAMENTELGMNHVGQPVLNKALSKFQQLTCYILSRHSRILFILRAMQMISLKLHGLLPPYKSHSHLRNRYNSLTAQAHQKIQRVHNWRALNIMCTITTKFQP